MNIILASASPRRQELLKLIFDDFRILTADIEEVCPENLHPLGRPEYLALQKAREIAKDHPESLVIGADTAVFLGDTMLGKPKDDIDAAQMLSALSGREHLVITGCAVILGDKEIGFSVTSKVKFFDLSAADIDWYIGTREHTDKAGGYGIQGKGSLLVEKIEGDYFNIVGLPVAELNRKIKENF